MTYIVCFLLSTAFAWLASRSKEKAGVFLWSALSILVLCVLGGLRYGFDQIDTNLYAWPDYCTANKAGSYAEFLELNPKHEAGYMLLCYIANKVFGHFNWSLFFYHTVTVTCFYIGAYKHRKQTSLPLLIFIFCFMYNNPAYENMRQSMACSIIFMGSNNLDEKKYLKFSIYIAVALLFHDSAVIAFLIIGLHMVMTSRTMLENNWLKFFISVGVVIALFFVKSIFFYIVTSTNSKYVAYADVYLAADYRGRINSVQFIFPIILATEYIILILCSKRTKTVLVPSGGGGANFYQFIFMFNTVYYVVIRLLSSRVLIYTNYMTLIVMAALPRLVREKHLKLIILIGVIITPVLYWYICFAVKNIYHTYPYHSILE